MSEPYTRDPSTKALLNSDLEGLAAYKRRKKMLENVQHLEEEINTIKSQLATVIELLQHKG